MAGKKKRQHKEANRDINVTPLIDVVLVLLIIFMVITPILIEEMAVKLPEKTQQVQPKDKDKNDQLVAAACLDGTFALNKRKMDLDSLADQVKRRLRSKSSKVVFIDGHPDAGYEKVVELIDTVRAAGADQIGIATLKENDQFKACGG